MRAAQDVLPEPPAFSNCDDTDTQIIAILPAPVEFATAEPAAMSLAEPATLPPAEPATRCAPAEPATLPPAEPATLHRGPPRCHGRTAVPTGGACHGATGGACHGAAGGACQGAAGRPRGGARGRACPPAGSRPSPRPAAPVPGGTVPFALAASASILLIGLGLLLVARLAGVRWLAGAAALAVIALGSCWCCAQAYRAHLLGRAAQVTPGTFPVLSAAISEARQQLGYLRPAMSSCPPRRGAPCSPALSGRTSWSSAETWPRTSASRGTGPSWISRSPRSSAR